MIEIMDKTPVKKTSEQEMEQRMEDINTIFNFEVGEIGMFHTSNIKSFKTYFYAYTKKKSEELGEERRVFTFKLQEIKGYYKVERIS